MLKRLVILLALCIPQLGCDAEYGEGFYPYDPMKLSDRAREGLERDKRDFLTIEDLTLGEGPLAAWGRRIIADLDVRYEDGTVAYQGQVVVWRGFGGSVGIHNSDSDPRLLSFKQTGIRLGLNGMAVGGKRRIIVEPKLICGDGESEPNPRKTCTLTRSGGVRKEKLIVEVVLLESCLPVSFRALYMNGSYAIHKVMGCKDSPEPKRDPSFPIWHMY